MFIDNKFKLGTTTSSRRYKTNIQNIPQGDTQLVDHLRPVQFNYLTADGDAQPTISHGLIAEEVADINPMLVVYDDEGLPLTVKYHELDAFYIAKMQQLQQQVDDLRSERESILQRLAALESLSATQTLVAA